MKILRYELEVTDEQVIELPLYARVLSVAPGRSRYHIDLWVLCAEVAPNVKETFYIIGTGNPCDSQHVSDFIGTCVMSDDMVWHVFR